MATRGGGGVGAKKGTGVSNPGPRHVASSDGHGAAAGGGDEHAPVPPLGSAVGADDASQSVSTGAPVAASLSADRFAALQDMLQRQFGALRAELDERDRTIRSELADIRGRRASESRSRSGSADGLKGSERERSSPVADDAAGARADSGGVAVGGGVSPAVHAAKPMTPPRGTPHSGKADNAVAAAGAGVSPSRATPLRVGSVSGGGADDGASHILAAVEASNAMTKTLLSDTVSVLAYSKLAASVTAPKLTSLKDGVSAFLLDWQQYVERCETLKYPPEPLTVAMGTTFDEATLSIPGWKEAADDSDRILLLTGHVHHLAWLHLAELRVAHWTSLETGVEAIRNYAITVFGKAKTFGKSGVYPEGISVVLLSGLPLRCRKRVLAAIERAALKTADLESIVKLILTMFTTDKEDGATVDTTYSKYRLKTHELTELFGRSGGADHAAAGAGADKASKSGGFNKFKNKGGGGGAAKSDDAATTTATATPATATASKGGAAAAGAGAGGGKPPTGGWGGHKPHGGGGGKGKDAGAGGNTGPRTAASVFEGPMGPQVDDVVGIPPTPGKAVADDDSVLRIPFSTFGVQGQGWLDTGSDVTLVARSFFNLLPASVQAQAKPAGCTIRGVGGAVISDAAFVRLRMGFALVADGLPRYSEATVQCYVVPDTMIPRDKVLFSGYHFTSPRSPIYHMVRAAQQRGEAATFTVPTKLNVPLRAVAAAVSLEASVSDPATEGAVHIADVAPAEASAIHSSDVWESDAVDEAAERMATIGKGGVPTDAQFAEAADKVGIPAARDRVLELMRKHSQLFGDIDKEPAGLRLAEFEFNTPEPRPFDVGRARTIHNPELLKALEEQVQAWEAAGIIKPAPTGEWGAPVVLARQRGENGKTKIRVCIDYARGLNQQLRPSPTVMPTVEEVVASCAGGKVFSVLDLRSMFLQIGVPEHLQKFLRFHVPGGRAFTVVRLPFGLNCSPGIAQVILGEVLSSITSKNRAGRLLLQFVDDLILVSPDLETHLEDLQQVMELLQQHRFRVNLAKAQLCQTSVRVLGEIISADGERKVDPNRLAGLDNLAKPTSLKQLQSFLSWVSYLRPHLKDLATLAAPLYDLAKPNTKIPSNWKPVHDLAFQRVIEAVKAAAVLVLPDWSKTWYVQTDASDVGIGGVILIPDADGVPKPYSYCSRLLTPAERAYGVGERELLALTWVIKRFEWALQGRRFVCLTDHANLRYLEQTSSPRLLRAWCYLLGFDFHLVHIKGTTNALADTLSRLVYSPPKSAPALPPAVWASRGVTTRGQAAREARDGGATSEVVLPTVGGAGDVAVVPAGKSAQWRARVVAAQQAVESATREQWRSNAAFSTVSTPDGDLWLRDGYIYIPREASALTEELMRAVHEQHGHAGCPRMKQALKSARVVWDCMAEDLARWSSSCSVCQRTRAPATMPDVGELSVKTPPSSPFRAWTLDTLGPLETTKAGNQHILVAVDQHSRLTELIPLPAATGDQVARAVREHIVMRYGIPDVWQTDGARALSGAKMDDLAKEFDISQRVGHALHPESQGIAERVNREIKKLFAGKPPAQRAEWDHALCEVRNLINSSYNRSIGMSPLEAAFGFAPKTSVDALTGAGKGVTLIDGSHRAAISAAVHATVVRNSNKSAEAAKRWHDKVHPHVEFKIGSKALYYAAPGGHKSKFDFAWLGPVTIIAKESDAYYVVEKIGGTRESMHVQRLTPFDASRTTETAELAHLLKPGEYLIKAIVGHEFTHDGQLLFTVSWLGVSTLTKMTAQELKGKRAFEDYCKERGLPFGSVKPVGHAVATSAK